MNVGKSALINRFTKNEFNPKMQNSVGGQVSSPEYLSVMSTLSVL